MANHFVTRKKSPCNSSIEWDRCEISSGINTVQGARLSVDHGVSDASGLKKPDASQGPLIRSWFDFVGTPGPHIAA